MIVFKQSTWDDEELRRAEAIIKNVVRLADDAELLLTYERRRTAFTLATLALEEIGKVLLRSWANRDERRRVDGKWTYHQQKQAAAACLLLSDVAVAQIRAYDASAAAPPRPIAGYDEPDELIELLAKSIAGSREGRLLELICMGAIEMTKQMGLYVDDWAIDTKLAEMVPAEAEVRASLDEVRKALRLVRSGMHIAVARAVYLTDPSRGRSAVRTSDIAARNGNLGPDR